MTEAIARAHPNIALIKYWGKRDERLNLPSAGSLSLTLAGLSTTTRVAFEESLEEDSVVLDGRVLENGRPRKRVSAFLDLIREAAGETRRAVVETTNDFPTAAGLASSASGFAALAVAATKAAGLELSPSELSVLSRRGSGSAARSIFGGFVEMKAGTSSDGTDAHAVEIAPADHWDLRCLIALTAQGEKEVGSTEGMRRTQETSPLFQPWIDTVDADITAAKKAIEARDFERLTTVAERSCLRMHATAIGADPGVIYWNSATLSVVHHLRKARSLGLSAFFTIDAGPHVKVFCPGPAVSEVRGLLESIEGVGGVIDARPGPGAWLKNTWKAPSI